MNVLSLFSGIGGIDLGLERAGHTIVAQCERDPQRRRILERHWPGVPCYTDVREVASGGGYGGHGEVDGNGSGPDRQPLRSGGREIDRADLVCGGFPCQDVSVAGRRAGLAGERSGLFFEFARVADAVGLIWAAAIKCARNGGSDAITVAAELERRGQLKEVGGRERLVSLAASVPAPGNASAYAKRVAELAELRRIRRSATALLDAVAKADDAEIAAAVAALGNPIRYVDVNSGELVETCPTCAEKDIILGKKERREWALLSRISRLEGKADQDARGHRLWPEIAYCFDLYKLATAHFEVTFTAEEFRQAHPRWKQYGKGKANPCKAALRAICGIAYDPTETRGRNRRQRVYDSWELLNRNQFSWADFGRRVPGESDTAWWRCLIDLIEANLKPA